MSPPRRPGTNADHDRFARPVTPATGVPVEFEGPATGVLEGDALLAARARRSTEERLARLEQRADDRDKRDDETAAALDRIGGELAEVGKGLAAVAAVIQDRGRPHSDTSQRETVKLAEQVLGKEHERRQFKHAALLQVIPGVTAIIVALIALARGC